MKKIDSASIITALNGNPNSRLCHCPAHDDTNASLSVDERNGQLLVKCRAGCPQTAVIAALRERGLWPDGRGNHSQLKRRGESRDELEDGYERFHHAYKILRAAKAAKAGHPTEYLKGRGLSIVPPCAMVLSPKKTAQYTGKHFPAIVCPITDGDKLIGTHLTWLSANKTEKLAVRDGKPRRMYGTVSGGFVQLSASDPDKPLVVGEGIESTLAAMQLSGWPGIAALSASNMPAIKLPPCSEVVIAADHDDAGRQAAAQLAERLEFEGHKVRVALPPSGGQDWNDRVQDCTEEVARDEWQHALEVAATPRGPISALEEAAFMDLAFPERQLYLAPWLPRAGLVMLHAARGEGKTWFSLAVAKAISNGSDLLGWSCPNDGRVLYIDGELPGASLQQRLDKFPRSPPNMFHVLCRDTFLLRKQLMPDLGEAVGRQELDRVIDQCDPNVIILDSISTLVRSGIENEAESWAPVQDWLLKHRWRGRTVILIHHENRTGRPRGTSKREDTLDTMIGLKKRAEDSTDDDTVFQLSFSKARDFFGKDAEPLLIRLAIRDGQVTWTHETVKTAREDKIRELLDAGVSQTDIAEELDLTKGRVNQIVQKMRLEGTVVTFPPKANRQHDEV
jgi:putative DNA primase/helicase